MMKTMMKTMMKKMNSSGVTRRVVLVTGMLWRRRQVLLRRTCG
jgi:hypothetical protein